MLKKWKVTLKNKNVESYFKKLKCVHKNSLCFLKQIRKVENVQFI